jgi:hypothetical protein
MKRLGGLCIFMDRRSELSWSLTSFQDTQQSRSSAAEDPHYDMHSAVRIVRSEMAREILRECVVRRSVRKLTRCDSKRRIH